MTVRALWYRMMMNHVLLMLLPSQTLSSLLYASSAFILYFLSFWSIQRDSLFDQNANSFATKWKREINCCVGCVLVLVFVKGLRCLITLCRSVVHYPPFNTRRPVRFLIRVSTVDDTLSSFWDNNEGREGRGFFQAIFSVFFWIFWWSGPSFVRKYLGGDGKIKSY